MYELFGLQSKVRKRQIYGRSSCAAAEGMTATFSYGESPEGKVN